MTVHEIPGFGRCDGRCFPCRGAGRVGGTEKEEAVTALDSNQRGEFLTRNPGWALDGETIRRTFEFSDFNGAMGFVVQVALLAETANHHPDIDIRWNEVTVALSTHSAGALTSKDTDLAGQIDALQEGLE